MKMLCEQSKSSSAQLYLIANDWVKPMSGTCYSTTSGKILVSNNIFLIGRENVFLGAYNTAIFKQSLVSNKMFF